MEKVEVNNAPKPWKECSVEIITAYLNFANDLNFKVLKF